MSCNPFLIFPPCSILNIPMAEQISVTPNFKTRFSWPHVVLSVVGMAISLYAWQLHSVIKAGGDSGCGISDTINCDKVLASQYGALFGIPLGAYGLAYFVLVLLVSVTTNPQVSVRQETLMRFLVCGAGMLGTLGLSYISYIVLKAACPVCMATHVVVLLSFLTALWQFLKTRQKSEG
jgi:uncharacterized membrane protein